MTTRSLTPEEWQSFFGGQARSAILSTCIYGADVAAWTAPDVAKGRFFDGDLNLRAGAEIHDGKAYIAFRGTVGPFLVAKNWLRVNLKSGWSSSEPAVHAGFWRAWLALKPQVLEWLRVHRPTSIYLTGHSMGAALAQLAAFDLHAEWPLTRMFLFATPMVGGEPFNDKYGAVGLQALTRHFLLLTDAISFPLPKLKGYVPPRFVNRIDKYGTDATRHPGAGMQAFSMLTNIRLRPTPPVFHDPFIEADPLVSVEEQLIPTIRLMVMSSGGSFAALLAMIGVALFSVGRRAVGYHRMTGYAGAMRQGHLTWTGRAPTWEHRIPLATFEETSTPRKQGM